MPKFIRRAMLTAGVAGLLAGAGVAGVYFRVGRDSFSDPFALGLTLMIIGVFLIGTAVVTYPAAEAWQDGRDTGHRDGFAEGRRVGRPTVVPIRGGRRTTDPLVIPSEFDSARNN